MGKKCQHRWKEASERREYNEGERGLTKNRAGVTSMKREADVTRQIDTDRLIREQEMMAELNRPKWSKVIKAPQEITEVRNVPVLQQEASSA